MNSRFINFLLGYEDGEKRMTQSGLARAGAKFKDILIGGQSTYAAALLKHPVSKFLGRLSEKILSASTRTYGMLFMTMGILTLLMDLANFYFTNTVVPVVDLIVGTVFAVVGILLLFVDLPFANLFQQWSVSNTLIYDVLCVKRAHISDSKREGNYVITIIIGAILAVLFFFFPIQLVLLALAAVIFLALAFASPEFSFMTTILLVPIYPLTPISTLLPVCMLAVTALSFIFKVFLGKRIYHFEQYDAVMILFALFILISGIFNKGFASFENSLVIVAVMLAYTLSSNLITNRRLAENAINILIFTSLPEAIYAIITYFLMPSHPEWIDPAFADTITARAMGTFGNPNIYAIYLTVAIIFSAGLALSRIGWRLRIFYVSAFILNTVALVMTWTRGAWIAVILAVLAALVIKSIRTPKLLLLPLALLPIIPFIIPHEITARLLSALNLTDSSISSRLSVWRSSLAMLKDNVFIGVGIGESSFRDEFAKYAEDGVTAPHSHNLFLEIACEAGIFALLLIAILFIIRLRHRATYAKYVRISTVSAAAGVSASALFAIIVFGMTDYIWYTASMQLIFWLVLGIGSAVLRIAKKEFDDSLMSRDENLVTLEAEANITIR